MGLGFGALHVNEGENLESRVVGVLGGDLRRVSREQDVLSQAVEGRELQY